MGVQEKNKGTLSNSSTGASNCPSNDEAQLDPLMRVGSLSSSGNENPLKVRKPYTISKQREKWTEEEHQRFLEALKLFGRGWRQIKEHIGSKTAVQIRSHAQKFFSKVVRECSGTVESFINPIEIPPPRPKRKPLHPYPRKAVDSLKAISVVRELEISVAEKETQSPTSVLSLDDQISVSVSEQHNTCPSPISQPADTQSTRLSSVTMGERGEENRMLSLQSSSQHFLTLKFEHGSSCNKVGYKLHSPVKSIKLFGSTVMVADDKKPSPHDLQVMESLALNGHSKNGCKPVHMLPSKHMDVNLSLRMDSSNGDWNMSPGGAATTITGNQDYPQTWSLYQNVPHFYLAPSDQTNHVMEERMQKYNSVEESSCVDSCSGSPSKDKNGSQSPEIECQEPSLVGRGTNGNESKKGFVPYKRCLAQRDRSSQLIDSEEHKCRRARVCL